MPQIYYNDLHTPIGSIKIAVTSKGVCYIEIVHMSNQQFEDGFSKKTGIVPIKDNSIGKYVEESFNEYFDGTLEQFKLPLDMIFGTPFQKNVWTSLQKIAFGSVRTYKWVAENIGIPKACRAVGNANGKNPIPIIIPCHRVVCTDGKLGGFSSGIEIKKQLLNHENVQGYC